MNVFIRKTPPPGDDDTLTSCFRVSVKTSPKTSYCEDTNTNGRRMLFVVTSRLPRPPVPPETQRYEDYEYSYISLT